MGQKSSKQQQPFPPYTYPPGPYGPPQAQQPFLPPGFQQPYPPFNQAVIPPPPGYGQGAALPQPQLSWLPQDKRRKGSRRKGSRRQRAQSEQFPGGFATSAGFPQPNTGGASSRSENPPPFIPPGTSASRSRSHARSRSQSAQPPPLFTPQGDGDRLANFSSPQAPSRNASRRAPTPFIPAFGDDDDDGDYSQQRQDAPVIPNSSRYQRDQPPITGDISDVLQPLPPASRSAFGPTGTRPTAPLRNPLPPPPRDLYEMTPYKSLLTLPQTTALLTATYGPSAAAAPTIVPAAATTTTGVIPQLYAQRPAPAPTKKKRVSGLLRAFSSKRHSQQPPPPAPIQPPSQVQFIPVFVPASQAQGQGQQASASNARPLQRATSTMGGVVNPAPASGTSTTTASPVEPNTGLSSAPGFSAAGFSSTGLTTGTATGFNSAGLSTGNNGGGLSTGRATFPDSAPPTAGSFAGGQGGTDPNNPIRFDQLQAHFAGLMNHSPHRVLYQNKMYPTATHLHEAMKYIEQRPDLAERIRQCLNVVDVYPLSRDFEGFQRPDWGDIFLSRMEEALLLKFKQHPNLRTLLLSTHPHPLVYADPIDPFWGEGPDGQGQNQLGHVLQKVRERLRHDSFIQ